MFQEFNMANDFLVVKPKGILLLYLAHILLIKFTYYFKRILNQKLIYPVR